MLLYFCSLVNDEFSKQLHPDSYSYHRNNLHLKASCRQLVETALVDGSARV